MNSQLLITAAILLLLPFPLNAQGQLTEKKLIELTKKSPTIERLGLSAKQGQLNSQQSREKYEAGLFSTIQRTDTNEQPAFPGSVVFGPTDTLSVGLNKNFEKGISTQIVGAVDQRSTTDGLVSDFTTTSLDLSLTIDLWKNFLGRLDKQSLSSTDLQRERLEIEKDIGVKSFSIDVRKIYWSLVANRESQSIAKELLRNAERQLKETQRRYRSSVANDSDVSRLKAQVVSRTNLLNSLKLQQTMLEQQLAIAVPQLAGSPINLAPVNLESMVSDVLQCTAAIKTSSSDPLKNTKYAALLRTLDMKYEQDSAVSDSYSGADLKLVSSYKLQGRSDDYEDSLSNFESETINGFSVALQFSMPIGGAKDDSQQTLKNLQRMAHDSEKADLLARLKAQRTVISPQIDLLYQSILKQKENSKLIAQSSKSIEKQYKQARISIMELIREQDSLQDSQLKEIDAYLLVVNTLLDYFKLFHDTPCNINA